MKELGELLSKYDAKASMTGNDLTDPVEFNLMFATSIGPSGLIPGWVRQLSQSLFVLTLGQKIFTTMKILMVKCRVLSAWNNHVVVVEPGSQWTSALNRNKLTGPLNNATVFEKLDPSNSVHFKSHQKCSFLLGLYCFKGLKKNNFLR